MTTAVAAVYVALICGALPVLAYLGKKKLDEGLVVPRMALYTEGVVVQTLLLAVSYGVATATGVTLFRPPRLEAAGVVAGAVLLAAALAAAWIGWRFARGASRRRLEMLIPATRTEKLAWIGISLAAAVGEEVAFRGVLPVLLRRMTGSFWAAIAISVAAFALSHLLQGWSGAAFVGIFALAFHGLVLLTGGLWVAIAVHFLYDVVAGLTLGRVIRAPEAADAPL